MLYPILNICWTNAFTHAKSNPSSEISRNLPKSTMLPYIQGHTASVKYMQFSHFNGIWTWLQFSETYDLIFNSPSLQPKFGICKWSRMASSFAKVILYLSQEKSSALCVTACPAAGEMLLWTRFPWGIMDSRGQCYCSWLYTASS